MGVGTCENGIVRERVSLLTLTLHPTELRLCILSGRREGALLPKVPRPVDSLKFDPDKSISEDVN